MQLLPGENVEGNIIALERFQANKAVRHVWQQRSKLLRKNFVFTNNSQMFSNMFLISMDRQNNTVSLLYFQTFKTSVGIYTSQIYTNKLSARIGMGFYCLRPFVCQKGRQTSRPNYNSAHDDWNLGQDRCTNLHVKVF